MSLMPIVLDAPEVSGEVLAALGVAGAVCLMVLAFAFMVARERGEI